MWHNHKHLVGMSKGRERERVGAIPSRQGGKGRGGGALGELRGEVLVLGVASGGGGVLGAVEVRDVVAGAVFPGRGSTRGHSAPIYSYHL